MGGGKGCGWAGEIEDKLEKRCGKKDSKGVTGFDACPCACISEA